MAKDEESSMPMSSAGLTRYFKDSPEKLKLKPEYVIGLVIGLFILEIFLYMFL